MNRDNIYDLVSKNARAWQENPKNKKLLLRGMNLTMALELLNNKKMNFLTKKEVEFIKASVNRKKNFRNMVFICFFAILVGAYLFLNDSRNEIWKFVDKKIEVKEKIVENSPKVDEVKVVETQKDEPKESVVEKEEPKVENVTEERVEKKVELVETTSEPKDTATVFKHGGVVKGVKFSADETKILSWGDDNRAKLWDSESAKELLVIEHLNIFGAKFSSDETKIITWSAGKEKNSVKIWDVNDGKELLSFDYKGDVAFGNDENRVISWGSDNKIRIWDAKNGKSLLKIGHHKILGAKFNKDGKKILSWGGDKRVKVLRTKNGGRYFVLKHKNSVTDAIFSMDELKILSKSGKQITLWSIKKKARKLFTLNHKKLVFGMKFSSDEKKILTWSGDYKKSPKTFIKIWNGIRGKKLLNITLNEKIYDARFSKDEKFIITTGAEKGIFWSAKSGEKLLTIEQKSENGGKLGIKLSQDNSKILSWGGDSKVKLWDANSNEELASFEHEDVILGAKFSADESKIISWSGDNIKINSVRRDQEKKRLRN